VSELSEIIDQLVFGLEAEGLGVTVLRSIPPGDDKLDLPAVVVEFYDLDSVEFSDAFGVEFTATLNFHCITAPEQIDARLAAQDLAAQIMLFLRRNPRPVANQGHIELVRAGQSDFSPQLDNYRVWLVESRMQVRVGSLEDPAYA